MSNTDRAALRKMLSAPLAAALLLGSMYTAAPAGAMGVHGQLDHRQTFYSTAQKTQQVGVAYIYCDGHFTMSGSSSPYFTIVYSSPPCP